MSSDFYTLTYVDQNGKILSQKGGLTLADGRHLPRIACPGGRYFHRSDHDISADWIRTRHSIKDRIRESSPRVPSLSVSQARRAALLEKILQDPLIICEEIA